MVVDTILRAALSILALMRPVYWAKNLLIFVPAYLADSMHDLDQLINCFYGFLLFCICASGTYVFNDWADATKDAVHITKKTRPLASGAVDRNFALAISASIVACALLAAIMWRPDVALLLAGYTTASSVYTVLLKNVFVLDGLWLSVLHLLRLWVGGAIAAVALSPALIAFSLLFFFSLAMAKRYGEISWMIAQNLAVETGRPYRQSNAMHVLVIGATAAGAAIGILSLYAARYFPIAPLFQSPMFLWFDVAVVGAWLFYVWNSAWRGLLTTDPIAFALRDRTSLFFLILLLTSFVLSREFA